MRSHKYLIVLLVFFILILPSITHASTTGSAWGENVGWIDFSTNAGAVTVADSTLSGYAYGENIGWIVLDGIANTNGTLSGYAWGENVGWIDFSYVTINTSTGVFSGYAYGENIGWINFTTDSPVTTSWRPTVVATPTLSSGGSSASSRIQNLIARGNLKLAQELMNQYPNAVPTIIPTTPTPPVITTTTFSRTLILGQEGNDVKTLQKYLNGKGYIIAKTGPGSIDNETTIFGGLTKKALIKFQKVNSIPATGFFGPITKKFIINHP